MRHVDECVEREADVDSMSLKGGKSKPWYAIFIWWLDLRSDARIIYWVKRDHATYPASTLSSSQVPTPVVCALLGSAKICPSSMNRSELQSFHERQIALAQPAAWHFLGIMDLMCEKVPQRCKLHIQFDEICSRMSYSVRAKEQSSNRNKKDDILSLVKDYWSGKKELRVKNICALFAW